MSGFDLRQAQADLENVFELGSRYSTHSSALPFPPAESLPGVTSQKRRLFRRSRRLPTQEISMSAMRFSEPDQAIIARRASIVEGLARLVSLGSLITSRDECRAYETDALIAY